jgi:hypothetical protein
MVPHSAYRWLRGDNFTRFNLRLAPKAALEIGTWRRGKEKCRKISSFLGRNGKQLGEALYDQRLAALSGA